jgi:UDP-glucuronate decarboxylase
MARGRGSRACALMLVIAIALVCAAGTSGTRTSPRGTTERGYARANEDARDDGDVGASRFATQGRGMKMEEGRDGEETRATGASAMMEKTFETKKSTTSFADENEDEVVGVDEAVDGDEAVDVGVRASTTMIDAVSSKPSSKSSSNSSSKSSKVARALSVDVAEIGVAGQSASKSSTVGEIGASELVGRGTVAKTMPVPIPKATRLRVLVTGGAGFVGSHLVDRLMERGNIVIVADNFFTGRKENIMHHLQNPFFELIRHDVVEPMLVEVDQIYHLACPASPVHYKHNPVKTIKTSVMGTLNMLGLAKRVGARMLLTSTSEVYGDPLEHPQKESYWGNVNPIGVRSCYDEGKRVAETLCFDYHRQEGVDIRIARIFNTYGPRMALEDGRVVSNFVSQALRGEPLTVYGDGKQTRSFQYVDDLVAGLMALMDNENEIGPVNIGNPGEFTMIELAEVVKEVVNKDAKIEFKENTADDPGRRKPDITLAKTALGWEPKITLREGLPKMVEDFRERLQVGDKKEL